MHKYEIAGLLGKKYGYSSYLEICTPTTGLTFAQVDKSQFLRRVRAIYKYQPDYSDGEQIDFSTESENADEIFSKLVRSGEKFDLIFIDSYHTYSASLRDLVYGMQLINQNGIILIHDCFPPTKESAWPEFVPGGWCGLTFAAFLDIVLFKHGIHYATVDSDFGCGMISFDNRLSKISNPPLDSNLLLEWRRLPLMQKYPFFENHHRELLHLISPDQFIKFLSEEFSEITTAHTTHREPEFSINSQILTNISLEREPNYLQSLQNTLPRRIYDFMANIPIIHTIYNKFIRPIMVSLGIHRKQK